MLTPMLHKKMTERTSIFHTILAATATPHATDDAVMTAFRLARRQNARLKIVHAVPLLRALGHTERSIPNPTLEINRIENYYAQKAQMLYALYAEHYPELKTDDILIAPGVAWEAVFRTAVEIGSDLIVVGPHTRLAEAMSRPKTERFIGSTSDGVIRQARCPVLIANRAFYSDMLEFTNIVVGVDFSSSCVSAICLAALIAKRCGSFISTFHMLPIPPYPKYTPQALEAERMRMQKRLNVLCSRLLEGIGHQLFLKPGARPHEELLHFAKQFGADLIIMGSHTKEKTGKWYAGSVVQQVAIHSECPVLVVNGLEALTPWKLVNWPIDRFDHSTI